MSRKSVRESKSKLVRQRIPCDYDGCKRAAAWVRTYENGTLFACATHRKAPFGFNQWITLAKWRQPKETK